MDKVHNERPQSLLPVALPPERRLGKGLTIPKLPTGELRCNVRQCLVAPTKNGSCFQLKH